MEENNNEVKNEVTEEKAEVQVPVENTTGEVKSQQTQQDSKPPKKNNYLSLIIIVVVFFAAVIGGFLLFTSGVFKDFNKVKNEVEKEIEKKDEKDETKKDDISNNNEQKDAKYTITKEEVESFLEKYGDFLLSQDDEYFEYHIFYTCVEYLVSNNKYTTEQGEDGGKIFVFNEEDVKELVYKLYMRDSIEYRSEGMQVTYDPSNKTIKADIRTSLFGEGEGPELKSTTTKTIENFKFENGIAELDYIIKTTFGEPVYDTNNNLITENNIIYKIKFHKVDEELRIKEIHSKN